MSQQIKIDLIYRHNQVADFLTQHKEIPSRSQNCPRMAGCQKEAVLFRLHMSEGSAGTCARHVGLLLLRKFRVR